MSLFFFLVSECRSPDLLL